MERLLAGRVALVTGASRGIGAATAKLLAGQGAAVIVNYFASQAAAEAVVAEIETKGGRALAIKANIKEEDEVRAMVEQASAALGAIDTLIVNASGSFVIAPFVDYKWQDFEAKVLEETKAAFFPCKAVVPSMIKNRRGCIIVISTGLSRAPNMGFIAHSTAKSGLDAFVKSLAFELGQFNIRANTVAPGLTITDATAFLPQQQKDIVAQMTPMRRNATPEEIAGAILMLCSDHARFVTGAYIPVSGGALML